MSRGRHGRWRAKGWRGGEIATPRCLLSLEMFACCCCACLRLFMDVHRALADWLWVVGATSVTARRPRKHTTPSPAQPSLSAGWDGGTQPDASPAEDERSKESSQHDGDGGPPPLRHRLCNAPLFGPRECRSPLELGFFLLAMCMRRERPNQAMFGRMHRSRIPSVEKAMGCTSAHEAAGRQAGRHGLALNIRKGGVQLH